MTFLAEGRLGLSAFFQYTVSKGQTTAKQTFEGLLEAFLVPRHGSEWRVLIAIVNSTG